MSHLPPRVHDEAAWRALADLFEAVTGQNAVQIRDVVEALPAPLSSGQALAEQLREDLPQNEAVRWLLTATVAAKAAAYTDCPAAAQLRDMALAHLGEHLDTFVGWVESNPKPQVRLVS